jgi:hypothetical protein
MTDRLQDIANFEAAISRLAASLAPHHVVIEKREYRPEAFHSWQIVAGTQKKRIDFFYDGQVSELRYHDAAVIPKDWRDVQHASFRTWEGEDPMAFVEDVLKKEFPA